MDDDENNTYVIRPHFEDKFRPDKVREIIHSVLQDYFCDKKYDSAAALNWSQEVCDLVKERCKELNYLRYKLVAQAVCGEQRGGGVKMACRCIWDSDTDNYAQDVYVSDTLFCVVAVYGIYFY